jgi:hypothetical protein
VTAPKRRPARRATGAKAALSRSRASTSASGAAWKPVRAQIAVRCAPGAEQKVRSVLTAYGRVENFSPARLLVLHLDADGSKTALNRALDRMKAGGLVEFSGPVLKDPESASRVVPTDELIVRMKPAAAKRTLARLKDELGIEVLRQSEFEPAKYVVRLPAASGASAVDVARSIDRWADIESASANVLAEIKR